MCMCPCVPDRIGIWKCWSLSVGENRSTLGKTSRSKGENQQQTQPTYGVNAGSWTRATLVGGECSQHCATLAVSSEQNEKIERSRVNEVSGQSFQLCSRKFVRFRVNVALNTCPDWFIVHISSCDHATHPPFQAYGVFRTVYCRKP